MKLYDSGVYLVNGNELVPDGANAIEEVVKKTGAAVTKEQAAENTIAYGILKNHNTSVTRMIRQPDREDCKTLPVNVSLLKETLASILG